MMSRAAIEWEKLDHIEISAFLTGADIAVDPTIAGAKGSAEAQTPHEPGQRTASPRRKIGSQSGSLRPQARPGRAEGGRSSGRQGLSTTGFAPRRAIAQRKGLLTSAVAIFKHGISRSIVPLSQYRTERVP
jgi:hypothetical protein